MRNLRTALILTALGAPTVALGVRASAGQPFDWRQAAEIAPGQIAPPHSYLMVIVHGHPGTFRDLMHIEPNLDECKADAERGAEATRARGEELGGLECFPMIDGDGPSIVLHKAGDP